MTDDERVGAPLGDADDGDRIAPHLMRPLRAPERLDSTFAARVMSAVHADARGRPAPRTSWWTRKRTVQISPLGGLAMVAGIAGLVVLGSIARDWSPGRSDPRAPVARVGAAAETVHVVRFVFSDREAQAVSLVGDFNAWSKSATPLVEQTGTGTWVVTLELPRGRHEYAFVVHRGTEERWAADPFGVPVRDEFGTESSIVTVDAPRSPIARVTTS